MKFRTALKGATAPIALAVALAANPVSAQEEGVDILPSGPAAEESDVIFVTGTRVPRPETDTAIPVVSVTAENIEQSGLTNVTELLTQTPALFNSEDNFDAAGDNARFGGAGVNLLDLRNLGAKRTLVLVDGRRHIAGVSGESGVDITTIPVALIERVDVLTGGVSSVYGADGVSGVVNFIMRDDFEGIDARAQAGISDFGDAESFFGAVTAGTNFADNRGNLAVSYEYRWDARVEYPQRPFGSDDATLLVRNPDDIPDDPNVLDNIPLSDIGWADSAPGGAFIVNTSLTPAFLGNGQPYDPGIFLPQSGFLAIGGDNTPVPSYYGDFQARTEHHLANVNFHYDLTPGIRFFAEGKYVKSDNFTVSQPSFDFYTFLTAENPFIPDEIRAAINPGNFAGFGLPDGLLFNRDNFDFGTRDEFLNRDLWRGVGGFSGDVGENANFEVSYVYGRNSADFISDDNRIEDRYFAALDAVVGPDGQPTCRINLPGQTIVNPFDYGLEPTTFEPGECVPLNVFGEGAASQESLDFILADLQNEYTLEQHVVSAFVAGDFRNFFELPGGPIGFAFGGEYREESSEFIPDPIATIQDEPETDTSPASGVLADLALLDAEVGQFDVIEGFAELNFPILADRPFFELLEVSSAIRLSDYSTTGASTSWSVSGQWAPIRPLRFRGSYSESVRAPNITELFAPTTGAFSFLSDPCSPVNVNQGTEFRAANCRALIEGLGADFDTFDFDSDIASSASLQGIVGGNQNLTEESARTWTAGVIFQPTFVPGLIVSFDWFDIYLSDAVNTATLQQTTEFCVDAPTLDNPFCDNITRAQGTAFVTSYILQPVNVAFFETAGADVTLNYNTDLGGDQQLNIRGTLGYLDKLTYLPAPGGTPDIDRGEVGAPKFNGNADITWSNTNWEVNYGFQFIGEQARFALDAIEADPDIAANEYIYSDPRIIHDVRVAYTTANDMFSIYGGINNFSNELPDLGSTATPTGWLGRYFFAGIRVRTDGLNGLGF